MKFYLAGPMTGLKDLNHPLFVNETARLRALGYSVVNPVEINPDKNAKWADCMRADIAQLITCEAVACLPDWTSSKGAVLEVQIAKALGMRVCMAQDLIYGHRHCSGNCNQGRNCTCRVTA